MLGLEVFQLAEADAVLAAAGAVEFQRALDETLADARHGGELLLIIWIQHDDQVKIAVAGVTDERRDDVCLLQILLRLEDALGEV